MNAVLAAVPAVPPEEPATPPARRGRIRHSSPPMMADSLRNFVALAARDQTIDVGKFEALLRIQRELIADDARMQFIQAMSAAQGEMVPVVRDATNELTSSRWARLETIDALIRPIYVRHGFCLSFNSAPPTLEGTDIRILCDVAHAGGHIKPYQLDAPLDTIGPKDIPNKTPLSCCLT